MILKPSSDKLRTIFNDKIMSETWELSQRILEHKKGFRYVYLHAEEIGRVTIQNRDFSNFLDIGREIMDSRGNQVGIIVDWGYHSNSSTIRLVVHMNYLDMRHLNLGDV